MRTRLGLLIVAVVCLAATTGAQDYRFSVPEMLLDVYVNPDGLHHARLHRHVPVQPRRPLDRYRGCRPARPGLRHQQHDGLDQRHPRLRDPQVHRDRLRRRGAVGRNEPTPAEAASSAWPPCPTASTRTPRTRTTPRCGLRPRGGTRSMSRVRARSPSSSTSPAPSSRRRCCTRAATSRSRARRGQDHRRLASGE